MSGRRTEDGIRRAPSTWQLARLVKPHPFAGRYVWVGRPQRILPHTEVDELSRVGRPKQRDHTLACATNVLIRDSEGILCLMIEPQFFVRLPHYQQDVPTLDSTAWTRKRAEAAYPPELGA